MPELLSILAEKSSLSTVPVDPPKRYVRFRDCCLDTKIQAFFQGGSRRCLAGKCYTALLVFLDRPNQLVEREELYERLWPASTNVDVYTNVSNIINKMRRLLGDSADLS